MGMYTWLSDQEFKLYSSVEDEDMNEALQEVRELMPEWYILERKYFTKKWWWSKPKEVFYYEVYERIWKSTEVRIQWSATNYKTIMNLLYGLYMGYHKAKEDEKLSK